ncbi:MAG TPA: hypothetical protein VHP11_04400 [Tepidisphaeraceae bacterium]|nr:hypothetical protein [Tepidisphaeraceae bacterium]
MVIGVGLVLGLATALRGQFSKDGPAGPGGVVRLPYTVPDGQGNQWFVYPNGQLQQQGNMPVYGQAAMLQINGMYPQNRQNQGKLDEKTGELIIENLAAGGFTLTRRISINKDEGYVRYIDVIRNTQNREQVANLTLSTNTNYGMQMASVLADPKRVEQNLAWIGTTHANGRVVCEMYGGKGAKVVPTINYQQGSNSVQAVISPSLLPGKEVAFMHFHYLCNSQDVGTKFVLNMKEAKVMASIPLAIRKLIINFRGAENLVGEYEILRGDLLDVIELRSGDQLKGTLQEKSYRLNSFYGVVDLAVENVIGLINAGEFRPRQLVITKNGEIYGGKLDREVLSLRLSSGQVAEIPLSQITRMGYRKGTAEPEEWTFEKPIVLMDKGDRIGVQLPAQEIEAVTRYGQLKIKPEFIAAIDFQVEEHGVHEICLSDGSRFAGLIPAGVFEMKLSGVGTDQVVKFPSSNIRRLQFIGKVEEPDDLQPKLELAHEDVLVGSLTGTLRLNTAFSTLTLNASEIKRLVHTASSPTDVQVVMWDDTTVSGQLQEQELACQLRSGLSLNVPVSLVKEYSQPRPQPSAAVIEGIKALVAELNADDWKQRDRAQERLVTMGSIVIPTLKQLRGEQSPEAQQRIDLMLKQLDKGAAGPSNSQPAGAVAPVPPPPVLEVNEIEGDVDHLAMMNVDVLEVDAPEVVDAEQEMAVPETVAVQEDGD